MIRVVHPGSGCWLSTHPRSRIQGLKRHPIPDPGSGSATLILPHGGVVRSLRWTCTDEARPRESRNRDYQIVGQHTLPTSSFLAALVKILYQISHTLCSIICGREQRHCAEIHVVCWEYLSLWCTAEHHRIVMFTYSNCLYWCPLQASD